MVELRVAIPEMEPLLKRLRTAPALVERELQRAMLESVLIAEREIVQRTPVDTGRLRNAISSRVEGSGRQITGIVETSPLDYAIYQEYGTGQHTDYPGASKRPYVIEPKTKKALAFKTPGGMIIRRRVMHPGVRAKRMFRDGGAAAEPKIRRRFVLALERVTSTLAGGR